jgi:hypothetical protein
MAAKPFRQVVGEPVNLLRQWSAWGKRGIERTLGNRLPFQELIGTADRGEMVAVRPGTLPIPTK